MTATAVDERTLLPGPTRPPSGPTTSFPLTNRRVVLADDPCEAGLSGADSEYAGIYLHARYFDPKLGTFLSPDPIGVAGGMNEYAYGFGDPVNGADRRGLLKDQCDEGDTSCRRYSEDITVTGYISSLLQVFLNVLWYNPAIPSSQPTTSDPTAGGGTTTCTGPNC